MVVGLTIELTLKWRDHNIDYENLKNVKDEEGLFRIIPNTVLGSRGRVIRIY